MARRFPNAPLPQLDVPPDGAIAYSYLQASTKFDIPYFDNGELFEFTDPKGAKTAVASFGVRKEDDYAYEKLRGQVQVLFRGREKRAGGEIPEFVVDLCKTSEPYQIVLSRIDRKATLAETLDEIEKLIKAHPPREHESSLSINDTLLVPNMAWQVSHHFQELEGKDKRILNSGLQGLYMDTALQTIRFRLDRSGAELRSESKIYWKPVATYFDFNRPYLIVMKKRNGKQPFFVMWFENAELLQRK
jgi:hypothetical protein